MICVERKSFSEMTCSVAQCLEVVGEWWSILIVRDAFLGVTRFDQFQQRLGISRNILNVRLNFTRLNEVHGEPSKGFDPSTLGGNGRVTVTFTPPLQVTTSSLPAATGGVPYSATLTAHGGVKPYTWSVTSGSLPPGMTLDSFTGVISGTSDVTGTYQFMVTVKDSEYPRMTASAVLSIAVSGPVITAVRPDNGPDFGGTPVMITGTGLSCPPNDGSCTVQVTFGGHSAEVEWAHPDQIAVVSPPGTGTVTITVTVAGVSSQATNADLFGYGSGAQRRGRGRGWQRGRVDERAAARPGLHGLVQRAAGQVLRPAQEPLGPAVVPGAAMRAAHDRDRVTGYGQVVVRLRVGG